MIGLRERFSPIRSACGGSPCSVLDFGWMDRIAAEGPVLIVAEGLFMYLSGEEVEALLQGHWGGALRKPCCWSRCWLRCWSAATGCTTR